MSDWRDKALLRPSELAFVSGRSKRTIHRLLKAGAIESRLEGGCRLIPIREAMRFVGEETRTSATSCERKPHAEAKATDILSHFRRKHG